MIFKAIFLGIVQGLTEFLPVSSTGHLIVVEHWLEVSQETFGLTFDVALHLGTLVALVGYFGRGLWGLLREDVRRLRRARGAIREKWGKEEIGEIKELFTFKIAVATLPAVVLGLILGSYIETVFRQPVLVAWTLILFGGVIWVADRKKGKMGEIREIGVREALIIGIFQALALFPGVSRSGATISGGMFSGLKRETSARFAFLLSMPIILGASAKRLYDIWPVVSQISGANLQFFLVGSLTSGFFGFLTIKYFLSYLKTACLWPFVVYRICLGLIILGVF